MSKTRLFIVFSKPTVRASYDSDHWSKAIGPISEHEIQTVWGKFGTIVDFYKPHDKPYFFLTYQTEEGAMNAFRDAALIFRGAQVEIEWSFDRKGRNGPPRNMSDGRQLQLGADQPSQERFPLPPSNLPFRPRRPISPHFYEASRGRERTWGAPLEENDNFRQRETAPRERRDESECEGERDRGCDRERVYKSRRSSAEYTSERKRRLSSRREEEKGRVSEHTRGREYERHRDSDRRRRKHSRVRSRERSRQSSPVRPRQRSHEHSRQRHRSRSPSPRAERPRDRKRSRHSSPRPSTEHDYRRRPHRPASPPLQRNSVPAEHHQPPRLGVGRVLSYGDTPPRHWHQRNEARPGQPRRWRGIGRPNVAPRAEDSEIHMHITVSPPLSDYQASGTVSPDQAEWRAGAKSPPRPEKSPVSPRFSPTNPQYSPVSPLQSPVAPRCSPVVPQHSPASPNFSPVSPSRSSPVRRLKSTYNAARADTRSAGSTPPRTARSPSFEDGSALPRSDVANAFEHHHQGNHSALAEMHSDQLEANQKESPPIDPNELNARLHRIRPQPSPQPQIDMKPRSLGLNKALSQGTWSSDHEELQRATRGLDAQEVEEFIAGRKKVQEWRTETNGHAKGLEEEEEDRIIEEGPSMDETKVPSVGGSATDWPPLNKVDEATAKIQAPASAPTSYQPSGFTRATCRLAVRNLSSKTTNESLEAVARQYGTVCQVSTHLHFIGEGMIEFESVDVMDAALDGLNGLVLEGQKLRLQRY